MNDKIKEFSEESKSFARNAYNSLKTAPDCEYEEWFDKVIREKFAELIVRECIYQIQRGIVLNGITPENKRSEKHISDIAHLFDMEFDYFGDDQ